MTIDTALCDLDPRVPTHDYQCPCDLCEPEAHSVQELPPTLPPSSRADVEARAFEELVTRVGEGRARWSRLLELLETGSND